MAKMHTRRRAVADLHRKFSDDLTTQLAASTNEVWGRIEQQRQPVQQQQQKLEPDPRRASSSRGPRDQK